MRQHCQLKIGIWQDSFFLELDALHKISFLYLLTNPKSTQCGIFEISVRQIHNETSLPIDVIEKQIDYFCQMGRLLWDPLTSEFMIVNWMRHHVPMNPSVFSSVAKELDQVRSAKLKDSWTYLQTHGGHLPVTCTPGVDTSPTGVDTCTPGVSDKEWSKIKEQEQQEQEEDQKEEPKKDQDPGYSSINLNNNHLLSLPELKQEEPESNENQPGEGRGPSFLDFKPEEEKKEPKQELETPPATDPCPEEVVIRYLNLKLCSGYRLDSGSTRKLIQKKLAEHFTVDDFRVVIDKKVADWRGTTYASNLCPHLLFGDNFEAYLQQAPRSDHRERNFGQRMPISTFHNHSDKIVEVF